MQKRGQLVTLVLDRNKLGDRGATAIARGLMLNYTLSTLGLSQNMVSTRWSGRTHGRSRVLNALAPPVLLQPEVGPVGSLVTADIRRWRGRVCSVSHRQQHAGALVLARASQGLGASSRGYPTAAL